jgi:hypothetical protein
LSECSISISDPEPGCKGLGCSMGCCVDGLSPPWGSIRGRGDSAEVPLLAPPIDLDISISNNLCKKQGNWYYLIFPVKLKITCKITKKNILYLDISLNSPKILLGI